ncbi:MAG: DUF1499 domain-containing protein [Chlorobiaceae bacterium]|nr:DUF1499 domain-containing protein [Chlorobiaceae bacterium]NTV26989.1 DUF1499 domain-containing protein [Chlorobiaceae bacterium]
MGLIDDLLAGVTGVTSNLWPQPAEKPQLINGRLRPCTGTPNCVCSEGDSPGGKVDPLTFSGTPDAAWSALKQTVADLGGTVRHESDGYLWTTFLIPLFGFTDDVEFRLDAGAKMIHVRSASRMGYSDLGVNKGRVEQLHSAFAKRCG